MPRISASTSSASNHSISNTKTGVVVSPNSIDKIANVSLEFIENHNKDDFNPDLEEIKKYERRKLTEKLASVFDKITKKGYNNYGNNKKIERNNSFR